MARQPALGAVVVVVNRLEVPADVEVWEERPEAPEGGNRTNLRIPPGGLVPVVVMLPPWIELRGATPPLRLRLDLNTIYEIARRGKSAPVIREVRVGNIRPAVWLLPPGKKLQRSVTIPIGIFVDDEQPAVQDVWEPRLRAQVQEASRFVEWFCGVRFDVVTVGTWESDDGAQSLEGLLADFRRKVIPGPALMALGFSSQLKVPESGEFHCPAGIFETHIILPDVHQTFSAQSQLWGIIHSFGHFLGCVDVPGEKSVMDPGLRSLQPDREARDYFDPVNTLIMNLVAEEIAFRNVRRVGEISTSTRSYLTGVYRWLGYRSRRPDVQRLLARFEESPGTYERYVAAWADGTVASGPEILNWGDTNAAAELAGKKLFDDANPVRWVFDTQAQRSSQPTESYVEFLGGDRLPGRVVGAVPAGLVDREFFPVQLEVTPYTRVDWPDGPVRDRIPVLASHVKRIVWQPRMPGYQPGSAFLSDGRRISFRAIQWTARGTKVLTDSGIQEISFEDLAELHLPAVDPWEEVICSRVGLAESPTDILVEFECTDGLRVTTALNRCIPRSRGDKNLPESWYHMVQPVWALQPLWIAHRSVVWRRLYRLTEVPLSCLNCVAYSERSALGGQWGYRVNVNLLGRPLHSGGRYHGWGFGVPASSELVFPLHPFVKALHLQLGLDTEVGDGGCIRGEIILEASSREVLCRSPVLMGSKTAFDPGEIRLEGRDLREARVILAVDEAEAERPAAVDPWNIRDVVDWLEPICILDGDEFGKDLRRRHRELFACWEGWQIVRPEDDAAHGPRVVLALDQTVWNWPRFRWFHVWRGEFALERTMNLPANIQSLEVLMCRPPGVPTYRIEILADGVALGSAVVAERGGPNPPDPMKVDLTPFAGRRTTLSIVLKPEAPDTDLKAEWRFIRLIRSDPTSTPQPE